MRILSIGLAAASALGLAVPANANWYVAKSRHFIIYANDNPKRLHDFADRLEKFDQSGPRSARPIPRLETATA